MYRDVEAPGDDREQAETSGRRVIAVIGIDRYRAWPRLTNAVGDARGAMAAFARLGFEPAAPPLFDEDATADAIRALTADQLSGLHTDDSLIVFFAGHGHTVTRALGGGGEVKTGYVVPVDGAEPGGSTVRWLRLDSWLRDLAQLPPRHILVILDACHSGIALGAVEKWRGAGDVATKSLEQLARRRSRRVITSALDDQRALDSGPVAGHSLFTGCLIEALDGGLARHGELITGTQLGLYLQQRVTTYPMSGQTPDVGALQEDNRGELLLRIVTTDGLAEDAGAERDEDGDGGETAPPEEPAEPVSEPAKTPTRKRKRTGRKPGTAANEPASASAAAEAARRPAQESAQAAAERRAAMAASGRWMLISAVLLALGLFTFRWAKAGSTGIGLRGMAECASGFCKTGGFQDVDQASLAVIGWSGLIAGFCLAIGAIAIGVRALGGDPRQTEPRLFGVVFTVTAAALVLFAIAGFALGLYEGGGSVSYSGPLAFGGLAGIGVHARRLRRLAARAP